ncbi:MAG TPA: hypothetical protein VK499_08755, partial [Propionibacteriaceae bacterium]|nr:hypothetical protein [Propionibacteriaceae bacterium]
RVAQENFGLNRAGKRDALFELRDCLAVPVVQQQRTTKIHRRKCQTPFIIQLAERISRLGELIFASLRVPDGVDQTQWDQGRC